VSHAPPLSLYVHLPWCVRKCPYCDFNSHPSKGELPERRYIEHLLADYDADTALAPDRPIETIFIGGGTPSLFSGAAIAALLDGLRDRAALSPEAEITLEANPGAADEARFAAYFEAGVNRLSIGGQSFEARHLARLGRIHGPADIDRAITAARDVGFRRINLDLMHGLPEQTVAEALHDLTRALGLGVDHVSWYQLTLEPRTPFAANPPTLPDEDTLADIERLGLECLAAAGLARYEISAFSRAEHVARHNLNYWRFGDYLGIGAGAHGKITDPAGRVIRTSKPLAPERYLSTAPGRLRTAADVTAEHLPGEFMLNALRLVDGVEVELFTQRTGQPTTAIADVWRTQVALDLMRSDRLALTPFGRRHLDTVVAAFL